jgi:hypothetical protein
MSKGGMQTQAIRSLYCKCGKETSRKIAYQNGDEICIHFTRKSTYWHIFKDNKIKRTFKRPIEWEF